MVVRNITKNAYYKNGFNLHGLGADGKYYELKPGQEGEVCAELVSRQKWLKKGYAEKVVEEKPVKEIVEKKSKKKDKKEEVKIADSDSDILS